MTNRLCSPIFLFLLFAFSFCSCKKSLLGDNSAATCDKLADTHVKPFTAITQNEEINLKADSLDGANYHWIGPGNFESYDQNPQVTYYANYTDRGWYYLTISHDGCEDVHDSVFVNVKFPQGTPSCSLTNNKADFSGAVLLGDQSFYYVSFGAGLTGYEVKANSSNGDIILSFSNYWATNTLEDGIYYTTSNPLPEFADIDKVHIADVNQSIYWTAEPGKAVYVSHVGGKAGIAFCDISFSGDWGGTLYHTTVNAQITQP